MVTQGLVIIYLRNMYRMGYICFAMLKGEISFFVNSLQITCDVHHILGDYSIKKLFSFFTTFVESISGLGKELDFHFINNS